MPKDGCTLLVKLILLDCLSSRHAGQLYKPRQNISVLEQVLILDNAFILLYLKLISIFFQKLLELEDAGEDERKELHGKIESLESIVRMLELKSKNSSDHGMVPFAVYQLLFLVTIFSLAHL